MKNYFKVQANKVFSGVCEVREELFLMLESWLCLWKEQRQGLKTKEKRAQLASRIPGRKVWAVLRKDAEDFGYRRREEGHYFS